MISPARFAALCWFDLFDYPLTELELEHWNMQTLSEKIGEVQLVNGFYCLKDREHIIRTRLSRLQLSYQKYRKARNAAWFFARIPYVRMVAVGNTLGFNNARKESDIDFFIVAERGHIFFVRCVSTLIAKLCGWRPTEHNKQDKVCLSFFVSTDALNVQSLQEASLTKVWPFDIYLHFWIYQLTVLYTEHGCYQTLIQENAWCRKLLKAAIAPQVAARGKIVISAFTHFFKRIGEWVLKSSLLERVLTTVQCKYLPQNLKETSGEGSQNTNVVISSKILKFHDQDKRVWFQKEFLKRYEQALKVY